MDIVKRAYTQAKELLPSNTPLNEVHQDMVLSMVRWIKLRVYARRDWPTREFGEYPKHLEEKVSR